MFYDLPLFAVIMVSLPCLLGAFAGYYIVHAHTVPFSGEDCDIEGAQYF
jgi:hypothetical protein